MTSTTSRHFHPSLLAELLQDLPHLRPQVYFKTSLVALSHAMEDQVLAGDGQPLVFANFQRERYYRQEARRYLRISQLARQVYILAAPETDFANADVPYKTIALDPADPLSQEWHLIVIDDHFATCLICRERLLRKQVAGEEWMDRDMDAARQFDGIWSFERQVVIKAAQHLIKRILNYRPDLESSLNAVQGRLKASPTSPKKKNTTPLNPAPFAERLITYLQAGQYKLRRTYRAIQVQERKERLVNRIGSAIRRTLDPEDILQIAVQELGEAAAVSRALVYRCQAHQDQVQIEQEYCRSGQPCLRGQLWPLKQNPFLEEVIRQGETMVSQDTATDPLLAAVQQAMQTYQIQAWMAVPILNQGRLVGMLELHQDQPYTWPLPTVELAESIALQLGVALIQAEAYQHLDELNHQLEALDQAKSDLIAVTGHELRTPLSTIQICLESLASDPEMPLEVRQEMLDTALQDAGRLRQLVQDFLTLSKLESGRVRWHIESVSAQECVELSLSTINARRRQGPVPTISTEIPESLPWVRADGEWLVEVLRQLLDNACKFTPASGQIRIRLQLVHLPPPADVHDLELNGHRPRIPMLQFTVADNGRGIASERLQAIFERFYQAEDSMRRSVGGTGLGLAISRLIIEAMGGWIWAESEGLERGSAFHFVLPALQ